MHIGGVMQYFFESSGSCGFSHSFDFRVEKLRLICGKELPPVVEASIAVEDAVENRSLDRVFVSSLCRSGFGHCSTTIARLSPESSVLQRSSGWSRDSIAFNRRLWPKGVVEKGAGERIEPVFARVFSPGKYRHGTYSVRHDTTKSPLSVFLPHCFSGFWPVFSGSCLVFFFRVLSGFSEKKEKTDSIFTEPLHSRCPLAVPETGWGGH